MRHPTARVPFPAALPRDERVATRPIIWLLGFFSFQNVYAVQSLLPLSAERRHPIDA